jgi:hypothetical protein
MLLDTGAVPLHFILVRHTTSILIAFLLSTHACFAEWQDDTRVFFENHCTDCHDDSSKKGGLDLLALERDITDINAVDLWTRIYDRVDSGEMPPPKKKERPSRDQIDQFLGKISPPLLAADKQLHDVHMRRLNRVEYEHTAQDLLATDIPLQHLLPEDPQAGGFDNNGAALAVSAELIERYLQAARLALDHAIVHGDPPATEIITVSAVDEVKPYFGKQYGYHDKRIVAYLTERTNYSKISTRSHRLPKRGRYRFKFTAAAHNSDKPIVFSITASDFKSAGATYVDLGYFEAPPKPKTFEIEAVLGEKFAIQFFAHGLPTWINDPDKTQSPGVGYSDVKISGPLNEEWPPGSHRRLLGDTNLKTGTLTDAERILKNFAARAFRRPVSDLELQRYTQMVTDKLAEGRDFEQSLRVALEAVLCSTNFLFLQDESIDSKLSYFLWNSQPDAAIPDETLDQKIERMLSDPRSHRFVTNFAGQWLKLRDIDETVPDTTLYDSFDDVLLVSMIWEAEAFFRTLLDENLSLTNFIDSDFAMLNGRLADHYAIPDVTGLDVKKVTLPKDSVRGGVLTQAAVLKVTANGTSTSPVLRGVWVLENILGRHIPPPPPNVGGIEPDIRSATTIREQLDLHRHTASCQACHQFIDPPGFALESFDPIGAFRENYLQFKVNPQHADKGWGSVVKAAPVDASGQLASGEAFQSVREFKKLIDPDTFAHTLTERLLTYALGREMGFSDRAAISGIVTNTKAKGNGFRTLLHEIIHSDTFQNPQ